MRPQITVWTIERTDLGYPQWFVNGDTNPRYDGSIPEYFYWTSDFHKCMKWTSKEDAENYIEDNGPVIGYLGEHDLIVTDHIISSNSLN